MMIRRSSSAGRRMAMYQAISAPSHVPAAAPTARRPALITTADVIEEMFDGVILDAPRPFTLAVAPQIWGPHPIAEAGQQRQLMTPGVPAFGETMQAEREAVARSTRRDVKIETIRLHKPMADGGVGLHRGKSRELSAASQGWSLLGDNTTFVFSRR